MSLPRFPIDRVMSTEDAGQIMGETVPASEPTIREAGVYVDKTTGEPTILYAPYPGDFAEFRRALLSIPYDRSTLRGGTGMRNVSRTFGFRPRSIPLRFESCRPAALAIDAPEAHARIVYAARLIDRWLQSELPEIVDRSQAAAAEISDDWRLSDDVYWTSGVVNSNSALPYHRDRNNFPVWSAMPVARRGVRGGYLSIPEYGVSIACRDGWVVCFNGYQLVHGVTPITVTAEDGYRLSCVYYCLRGLKNCADDAREQGEARARRTERERLIADPEHNTREALASRLSGRAQGGTGYAPLKGPRIVGEYLHNDIGTPPGKQAS